MAGEEVCTYLGAEGKRCDAAGPAARDLYELCTERQMQDDRMWVELCVLQQLWG